MDSQCTKAIADIGYLQGLQSLPCYGGLDLAAVSDLTSFVLVWPVKDRVYAYPWFWLPEHGIVARSKKDNVSYDMWSRQGLVELTPGSVTDWRYVTERIKQLAKIFKIREIGFDRYGARDTVSDLQDSKIGVVDVGQGFVSMSAPSKGLEELVLSGRLVHTGHPILRWNVDCARIASDPAGNIKPVKPERQRGSKRIDGVVALILAISRMQAALPKKKSIYSTRGILTL